MRKLYSTTLDEEITNNFRKACAKQELKMNDVLESIMVEFCRGNLVVEKQGRYSIKAK